MVATRLQHVLGRTSIIFDLTQAIPGEHLGKMIITRLRAGEKIDRHIDYATGHTAALQRYQTSLSVAPGVRFVVGEDELHVAPETAGFSTSKSLMPCSMAVARTAFLS